MSWEKVSAITAIVGIPIALVAIFAQVTTPEIRCGFGLDKSGCSDVDKPSPRAVPQVTQSPTVTPSPSLAKEKLDISTQSSLPSPQTAAIAKAEDLQDRLAGVWGYTSACEVNGEPVVHNKIIVFNENKTITEVIGLTFTTSESTFFSTKTTKTGWFIHVTYEWSIEEAFLYMKIVDREASIADVSVNGKSVKVNNSNAALIKIKSSLERSFLRGQTVKYKVLGAEKDSIVLEKTGGTRPLCENGFILKYTRVNPRKLK